MEDGTLYGAHKNGLVDGGGRGVGGGRGFPPPRAPPPPEQTSRIEHMFALRVHSVKKGVTTALITHKYL